MKRRLSPHPCHVCLLRILCNLIRKAVPAVPSTTVCLLCLFSRSTLIWLTTPKRKYVPACQSYLSPRNHIMTQNTRRTYTAVPASQLHDITISSIIWLCDSLNRAPIQEKPVLSCKYTCVSSPFFSVKPKNILPERYSRIPTVIRKLPHVIFHSPSLSTHTRDVAPSPWFQPCPSPYSHVLITIPKRPHRKIE